jgi:hypothetical protein
MVHAFQLLFIDCNYPKAFVWWIGLHAVMFYFLFSKFYKQTYVKKDKRVKVEVSNYKNSYISNYKFGFQDQKDDEKTKKSNFMLCFTTQTALYEKTDDVKEMSKGYTSDGNRLRNRVFIDNPRA